MKICFCSMIFENQAEAIKKSKVSLQLQNHKFISCIVRGLEENLGQYITLFNTTDIPSYPRYKSVFWKKKYWSHNGKKNIDIEIGKINLPVIKYLSEFWGLKKSLRKWIENNKEEELYILAYGRRLSHVLAINSLKKTYKNQIHTCMIFADLSGKHACGTTGLTAGKKYSMKERFSSYLLDRQVEWATKFDSFVLLTRQMADVLAIKGKPFVVIEGIHSEKSIPTKSKSQNKKKVVLYAGALEEQYGIISLVQAMKELPDSYELWLAGSGGLANQIKIIASEDNRIKYLGVQPWEKIVEIEREATILVNPRTNNGEYTKYSFPSKLIEFLAAGVPVIAYKLDGVPEEYDEYLQYIDGDGVNSLRKKILDIGELPPDIRKKIGQRGRNFVLENKNEKVQSRKILKMLVEIGEK